MAFDISGMVLSERYHDFDALTYTTSDSLSDTDQASYWFTGTPSDSINFIVLRPETRILVVASDGKRLYRANPGAGEMIKLMDISTIHAASVNPTWTWRWFNF